MFENVTGLAYTIIAFALVVGIGIVVLTKFSGATACKSGFWFNESYSICSNLTETANYTPTGLPYTTVSYITTELGSAGLAGWLPAIIALAIGLYFLYSFMGKGRKA